MMKQLFGWIALVIFSVSFPIFASAHSHVIESNPSENEILHTIPPTVSVTFNAPIEASFYSLEVYNKAGDRIDANESVVEENRLEGKLPDKIENGSYTMKWKIVSNDGHPTEGSLSFQLEVAPPKKETTIKEKSSTVEKQEMVIKDKKQANISTNIEPKNEIGLWQTLIQSILYISLSLYIGVLFFHFKLLPKNNFFQMDRKSWQLLYFAYAGLVLSTVLSLPIQVLNISGVLNMSSIREVLSSTTFGTAWLVAVSVLILLLITTYLMKKTKVNLLTILSFILLLAVMFTKSFIGHTMIVSVQAAAVAMNFLHLLSMSLWIGGLLAILILLPSVVRTIHSAEQKTLYWQVLQTFSSWSILFVSVLLASGVLNSLLHIDSVSSLVSTRYGQVLLAKIGLMFMMILFGTYHFFKTKRKKEKMGRSVWIEFSLGIIVLILAAILTQLPTSSF